VRVSRDKGRQGGWAATDLVLADGAVLVAAVAQNVLVGARVAAQAGLAGLVEQVEDD